MTEWLLEKLAAGELDVEPQQVVLGEAEAADGCFGFYAAVRSMPVVSWSQNGSSAARSFEVRRAWHKPIRAARSG